MLAITFSWSYCVIANYNTKTVSSSFFKFSLWHTDWEIALGSMVLAFRCTADPSARCQRDLWAYLVQPGIFKRDRCSKYERVSELVVVLTFEEDIAPGKAWVDTFRAQYKETEAKQQH